MTKKFVYNQKGFKFSGYNHAHEIKNYEYDYTIRGILFINEKNIYIRINDLSIYQGLEFKKISYKWNLNYNACITYLKTNYKKFKIYTSYDIIKNNCPDELKKEVLSC